ncbi:MAG TPA: hypothetical protein VHB77_07285 [Planctomycetaceae bacterium]|nr:hypothetical protein [Planctomycetaceae bacterium]
MEEHEVVLAVGDTLFIGDQVVTVIDIDEGEISFRIEQALPSAESLTADPHHTDTRCSVQSRPR